MAKQPIVRKICRRCKFWMIKGSENNPISFCKKRKKEVAISDNCETWVEATKDKYEKI